MIEKAPIVKILYDTIKHEKIGEREEAARQIHQYYLKQFVKWLNHSCWTGLGSYNIPIKDVEALLKEAGGG